VEKGRNVSARNKKSNQEQKTKLSSTLAEKNTKMIWDGRCEEVSVEVICNGIYLDK